MGKKLLALVLSLLLFLIAGCSTAAPKSEYTKYSAQFFGTFDTVVLIRGYCKTEEEFTAHAKRIQDRMTELHQLYDIYYEYSGINNLKTVNDNAGVQPVVVSEEILDLVEFSLEWYEKTNGQVNIALGPVLSIWHDYMARYSSDPTDAAIPPMEELQAATALCDISNVIVDREAKTVYLAEKGMRLDVGAIAKGYAAELVARENYEQGFGSFLISAGGNVVAGDAPLDGERSSWGIGIQDPFTADALGGGNTLDAAYVANECVVTSGDYQRFYMVGEERIHHIIDPDTLMPASYYRGVTVVTEDSGVADAASTALFTLPYEESYALAETMGWKALWVFADGTITCNEALKPQLRDRGGATGLL